MYGSGHEENFGFSDRAEAGVVRADGSYAEPGVILDLSGLDGIKIALGGTFRIECVDRDGHTRWVDDAKNSVCLAALDDVLNTYLRNGSSVAAWYVGLVDNAGFTAFAGGDLINSHSGWAENTAYTGTRIAWAPGASSGQSVTNASPLSFAMTATAVIRGLFLCSDTSSSAGGVKLFSTAAFSTGSQSVNNGDTIKVTYTVSAATS